MTRDNLAVSRTGIHIYRYYIYLCGIQTMPFDIALVSKYSGIIPIYSCVCAHSFCTMETKQKRKKGVSFCRYIGRIYLNATEKKPDSTANDNAFWSKLLLAPAQFGRFVYPCVYAYYTQ